MSLHVANNWSEVQDAMDAATESGAIVKLNFATASGTSQVFWEAPANASLIGLGTRVFSSYTNGDLTLITDDYASNNALIVVITNATGKFNAYGFSVKGGSGDAKFNGIVIFSGQSKKFHLDHLRVDNTTYATPNSAPLILCGGWLNGVIDRCTFDPLGISNCVKVGFDGRDADGEGDASWAADTGLGGTDFVFAEDNKYNQHLNGAKSNLTFNDGEHGGKYVIRFCSGVQGSVQTHPTGGGVTSRGARAWEFYQNNFDGVDASSSNFNSMFLSSGTGVAWGNSSIKGADNFITLHSMRRRNASHGGTYTQKAPPNGLGYAGPAYQTGTCTVSGTSVTKVTGSNFNVSWPANSMIIFWDGSDPSTCQSFGIASVGSVSALTLAESAGSLGTLTYVVGSNMDTNTDVLTGYPCADAPGMGKGDLLTGAYPSKLNDRTGVGPINALFAVTQNLEPIYEFLNTYSCSGCDHQVYLSNPDSDALQEDRDYYLYTGSFDGSVGVGVGTKAAMLAITSATDLTAFWVTDEGSWNRLTNSYYLGQGQLYKRIGGVWTLFYTPHQYPHELVLEDELSGVLAADPGSFVVTGTAATLKVTRKLIAASGSYALTGTAGGLKSARKLAAASGSYTVTGSDATLTVTTGDVIPPPTPPVLSVSSRYAETPNDGQVESYMRRYLNDV